MNLINSTFPYLHSTPETFLNYASKQDIGGLKGKNQWNDFDQAISEMKKKVNIAKRREKDFYNSFKDKNGNTIQSAEQWSNTFLIRKNTGTSLQQDILEAFNSIEMKNALMSLSTQLSETEVLEKISGKLSKETIKFLQKELKTSSLEEAVRKTLTNLLIIERGKRNKTASDKEIFTDLLKGIVPDIEKIITMTGRAKNIGQKGKYGKTIQQATKALIKKRTIIDNVNIKIKEILKIKLLNKNYDNETITEVLKIWDDLSKSKKIFDDKNFFKTDLTAFLDGDVSHISGGIQEVGSVFSLSLITNINLKNNIEIKDIYSYGQQLVKRYDTKNKVQSKTDTVIEMVNNTVHNTYRIQEKNAIAEVYNSLDSLNWAENIEQSFAKMTIQRESSLEHYFNIARTLSAKGQAFLKEDDISALSYLLVNYLTLSDPSYQGPPWAKERVGRNDIRKTVNLQTRGIIERLLSLNSISYFSDIPQEITEDANLETIDFIIFKSRILIPMSDIYKNIIEYLSDSKKYLIGASKMGNATQLQTSFNFKYSSSIVNSMNKEKEEKGPDPSQNYRQDSFVAIGENYGNKTIKNIGIRSVQLEIDPRKFHNLIAQTLQF